MDESEGPDRVLQPRDADSNEGYLGYLSDVRCQISGVPLCRTIACRKSSTLSTSFGPERPDRAVSQFDGRLRIT